MIKNIMITTVFTVLVMAGSVLNAAQASDEKIALVSLQKALNLVNDGKKAKDTLKKEYETKKKQIDTMKLDLEKLTKNLEKQQMVLSADALQTKRKELQAKFLDLQNKAATYERELKTKEAESAKKILDRLRQIVVSLSQKEGYTLVIENSADMVLYSKNAEDITQKVIQAFNKKKK